MSSVADVAKDASVYLGRCLLKPRYRFSREQRVHKKREYDHVFRGRSLVSTPYFSIFACQNKREEPRLGIALSKKHCPLAVDRGKVKRQIRESFRLHQDQLPPVDIVVLVRSRFCGTELAEGRSCLNDAWEKLSHLCCSKC